MSNLPARVGNSNVPEGFSPKEGKALQALTNREIATGIIGNTRLSVAHFLTNTAMQHTASLAQQAHALANGDEYLGSRLGALVDGYVQFARGELDGLRRNW